MNCFKTVKTTNAQCNMGDLRLTIPDMVLHHGDRIRVCILQKPEVVEGFNMPVVIFTDGCTVPIRHNRMVCSGCTPMRLYQDQLNKNCSGEPKARQYLDLIYSADTFSFWYVGPCRCLPKADVEFPVKEPPANNPTGGGGNQ